MSYSISTLLTRNLRDVFGENDPARRRAAIDELYTEEACSTIQERASTVAATRSIASQARSGPLTLTFDISQLPSPRNWAMAGGSNGYRVALVRRQLTLGPISSLPGTAGLPPSISFSTSYPERSSDRSASENAPRHAPSSPAAPGYAAALGNLGDTVGIEESRLEVGQTQDVD